MTYVPEWVIVAIFYMNILEIFLILSRAGKEEKDKEVSE